MLFTPAKAELLVWVVVNGRINTKERLHRLNVLRSDDLSCPLCKSHIESLSHLFFTCSFALKSWNPCYNKWGIYWVVADCPVTNFEVWLGVRFSGEVKKLWTSCFYTIVWSISEVRSKMIFENKVVNWDSFLVEVSHRWTSWISPWFGKRITQGEEA